ncbi:MAG: hypothetical protein LBK56_11170 [Gracilibacteraceae bacterium]|jgi:CRISPR-associated protein Csx10|nr:hypothetical protein [Gracilibacteraceae bacterium]
MVTNKTIKVTLLSDLCPASGDGFAGFVDTDVCFDDKGLPYIPGKRLKGCLRECGLDIISVDGSYVAAFAKLFGETGKLVPGALNLGNGRLAGYDNIASAIGGAHRSELAEIYTSIRSRTKMEDGKAAPGTLRTARVLNKAQIYEFPVSLADDAKTETYGFFEMCVKSLRWMGLNRSRGLGEIKCAVFDGTPQGGTALNLSDYGDQKTISYMIELIEPVISAERGGKPRGCEEYIFGSSILGAFAVRYIEKYGERNGFSRENAYQNNDFRRIFLDGAVIFTAALPYKDGAVFHPAPATLKTNKLKTRFADESGGIPDETEGELIGKSLGGFVSVDNGLVRRRDAEKTTFIHHARPADKGKGHAGKTGGEMFTYEALASGQTFAGSVIGSEDDLLLLSDLFAGDSILRIGRSRTAQYGKAEIKQLSAGAKANEITLKNGDTFRLVAVTPIILEDENGINTTDINIIKNALGADLEIIRRTCSETVIAGYNGKWLLSRGQERAIAEGGVVVFRYIGSGATLRMNFIGKRTGEGFGQIRLENVPQAGAGVFRLCGDDAAATVVMGSTLPEVIQLRKIKAAIAEGAEYGDKFKNPPRNANMQRVIAALRDSNDLGAFARKLCDIKQAEQEIAALEFATGKEKRYFETDAAHLAENHITELLTLRSYNFVAYRKFLSAAAQRIKQKRRANSGYAGEGGDSNEE